MRAGNRVALWVSCVTAATLLTVVSFGVVASRGQHPVATWLLSPGYFIGRTIFKEATGWIGSLLGALAIDVLFWSAIFLSTGVLFIRLRSRRGQRA